jgi:hypothetical protein
VSNYEEGYNGAHFIYHYVGESPWANSGKGSIRIGPQGDLAAGSKGEELKMKSRRIRLIALLVVGVLSSLAPVTQAATTLNVDINNLACSDAGGNPYCHIQPAVSAAPSGAIIQVAAGTYAEQLSVPAGTFTIQGAGSGGTFIDGSNTGRVLSVRLGASLTMSQFTLQHGNSGDVNGGGVLNLGTLALNNSVVLSNTSGNADGAGIYNSGTLTLNQTSVNLNYTGTASGDGGGLFNAGGSTTLTNSTVNGNTASIGDGGGIYNSHGSLTLTNSTVSANTAGGGGDGGGIYNSHTSLTLRNSTISGNQATNGDGGGIFNLSGTVKLNNDTIAKNAAGVGMAGHVGGGIVNTGLGAAMSVVNTIIAKNTATQGKPDCSGTLNSKGYNLLQNKAGCKLVGITTGNIIGKDPLLGPLQLNPPGNTQTRALLTGSPAINAGNPAPKDGKGNDCLPTDQRGVARTHRCDIGAYEYP